MKRISRRMLLAGFALAATSWACGDTTGPGGMVDVPFSGQRSWCAGFAPGVINVTQLMGPRGASLTNVLPGVWLARGTYDIAGTGYTSAVIDIGFIGNVVTGQDGESVEQVPYTVTGGALSGSFEAKGGFLQLTDGPGTPTVMISSGSSALDCVELY